MTAADLLKCTMREEAHLNGGAEWFGYIHRCVQHPRLSRRDKYLRASRGVESEWRVDGEPVADLAVAAERLSTPYRPTPDELALLSIVPDDYAPFSNRVRFIRLRDVGLVEAMDGKFRLTDTGRAALLGDNRAITAFDETGLSAKPSAVDRDR